MQVDLLAQHHGVVPAVDLPESFQSQAQEHWYQTQRPFNTTQLVQDLCLILEMLRIPYQKGISASSGLLLIDIAVTDRQVSADLKDLLCSELHQTLKVQRVHHCRPSSCIVWWGSSVSHTMTKYCLILVAVRLILWDVLHVRLAVLTLQPAVFCQPFLEYIGILYLCMLCCQLLQKC